MSEERQLKYIKDNGLERCEFDDDCDFCDSPEGGTWVQLCSIPEDVTEATYYICRKCINERAEFNYCEYCGTTLEQPEEICSGCQENIVQKHGL